MTSTTPPEPTKPTTGAGCLAGAALLVMIVASVSLWAVQVLQSDHFSGLAWGLIAGLVFLVVGSIVAVRRGADPAVVMTLAAIAALLLTLGVCSNGGPYPA